MPGGAGDTFIANLYFPFLQDVRGEEVTFSLGGKQVGSVKTDKNGLAEMPGY